MGAQHRQSSHDAFRQRVDRVRDEVDIVGVIGRVVKLGNGKAPRGKCPFHGSKSDSFAVYPDKARATCWGCQWSGDVIRFVQDYYGVEFGEALRRLEEEGRLDDLREAPVRRAKRDRARQDRPVVDSATLGKHLWNIGRRDFDAIRIYLRGRGVPDAMLGDDRLRDIRFVSLGPISPWREGGKPDDVPQAPAMVAMVRQPLSWAPIGVHVTFLTPDLADKMDRARPSGGKYPARKMLGEAGGGCVALGRFAGDAPLFVGEGIETVLSGMAIAGASAEAVGLAALSLNNLQGHARTIKGALPIYDPEPDPERAPALAFEHAGPVTVLIDADMKALDGWPIPNSDRVRLPRVIEHRGGPVVDRAISSLERSNLCAALAVQAWRASGCRASAIRPRMGLDFNDMVREAQ